MAPPKVLLFDIGGVCVLSPFRAILDYELSQSIPPGYINFAISASKPDGTWHRMERGEMLVGPDFYKGFKDDLSNERLWREYILRSRKRKAGAGEADADNTESIPPVPQIDTKYLLDAILKISRTPDPHMYPALKKLKASGRFLMAALSNTMSLPDDHWANEPHPDGDVRAIFDPFVSSAHTSVRKPERRAYDLALKMINEKWKQSGGQGTIRPEDVLFLDDIGENLKQGRNCGFRTIRVILGQTQDAVKELERVVEVDLTDSGAKL